MFGWFHHNDLGLWVLSLVKNSVGLVGNIDSRVHLVIHNATNEGDGPFWSIVAHNGDCWACSCIDLVAGLSEAHGIVPVLSPGPAQFAFIAFDPHAWSITAASHCVHEHLAQCEGYLRTGSALAHLHRQFLVYIASPMESFTVFRIYKALISSSGHHYNAIVWHF